MLVLYLKLVFLLISLLVEFFLINIGLHLTILDLNYFGIYLFMLGTVGSCITGILLFKTLMSISESK